VRTGHNIVATVAIECGDMYRRYGPPALRPVGETEFIAGVAAMFDSGKYGDTAGAAGIVAYVDLKLGAAAQPLLDAHRMASGGRLRGIRNPVAWLEDPEMQKTRIGTPGLMKDPGFRAGVALLGRNDLLLEAWVYHPQLPDLFDLARACPDTLIMLNHTGGPLGAGSFRGRRPQIFAQWRADMARLAELPNVWCKLGGLGLPVIGMDFDRSAQRPDSETLARTYKPYIDTAITLFGVDRCMFESDFPPDNVASDYATLWNAFKRIAAGCSESEKTALFCGSAAKAYRLQDTLDR
jgi:L-fuconolactonase